MWFNSTCWVMALDCLLATDARLQRPLTPGGLERGREAEGSTGHAAAFPALFLFPSHSRKKRSSFIHSSIDFQAVWQLQELEMQQWLDEVLCMGGVGASTGRRREGFFCSHTWAPDFLSGESRS